MVFFGSRATRIKDGQINNVACPACGNQTSMTYSIFGKYAHVYWIPVFPVGKESVAECNQCKQTFTIKELPQPIKSKFDLEKHGSGFPVWYFSGLGVLALLILGGFYLSKQHDADVKEYINNPQIGDIYTLEGERSGYHYTMRVTEVTSDSIYALTSDYEYNTKKLKELDKDENYSDEIYAFSKAEILTMFSDETIEDISRD